MKHEDLIKQFTQEHETKKNIINNLAEKLKELQFTEKHAQTRHSQDKTKEISEIFSFGKPLYVVSENNKNFRTFTSKKDLQDFLDK